MREKGRDVELHHQATNLSELECGQTFLRQGCSNTQTLDLRAPRHTRHPRHTQHTQHNTHDTHNTTHNTHNTEWDMNTGADCLDIFSSRSQARERMLCQLKVGNDLKSVLPAFEEIYFQWKQCAFQQSRWNDAIRCCPQIHYCVCVSNTGRDAGEEALVIRTTITS